jgi:UDP-glucose 4-epimerase
VTILVTGGAGYIGSHMALALLDAGEDVVVLDDLSTGFAWAVPSGAKFVEGDVGDQELVKHLLSRHAVDAVMHFAGSVVVPQSIRQPLLYYRNNTSNSRALIEAAIEAGMKHFIFSSTAAVYGITACEAIAESARPEPISPYGRSKLMTEIMLSDAAQAHDLRYIALRYFNVAGADPNGRAGQSTVGATHLIKVAVQAALGQRPALEVFGTDYPTTDGTCVRDYIHVSDLAQAHLSALKALRNGCESQVLNCGYGRGYSVFEVVESVKRVAGRDFPVRLAPRRPGDPAVVVANPERIRKTLDWVPRYANLDTIVAHALAWESQLSEGQAQDDQLSRRCGRRNQSKKSRTRS